MSTIGERIKQARKKRGLTQGQLAQAVGATSNMAVSRWERGEFAPERDWLAPLARELGVTVRWILDGDEDPPTTPPDLELAPELLALIAARGLPPPDEDDVAYLRAKARNHGAAAVQLARAYEGAVLGFSSRVEAASDTLTAANTRASVPKRRK